MAKDEDSRETSPRVGHGGSTGRGRVDADQCEQFGYLTSNEM